MQQVGLGSDFPPRDRAGGDEGRLAVVAFGGNAIIRAGQRGSEEEQTENLAVMARQLARMIRAGWSVVVTHGNGPQVGNIKLQQEAAASQVPAMPLDVCGAMSQGQIGYLLAQALSAEFARQGITRPVVAMVTRCEVDRQDEAFAHPTKPIGPFYDETTARRLGQENGWTLVPDAGRGFRRVVPSPLPRSLVEKQAIQLLARSGVVVIAAGGGGIPVLPTERKGYRGLEAVIDKDLAACMLAREVGADTLVLLTEVSEVAIHFGTPQQRSLGDISASDLRSLAAEGHFPPGSMGPKVQAATDFVAGGGKVAVITSPGLLMEGLAGAAGTRVHAGNGRGSAKATASSALKGNLLAQPVKAPKAVAATAGRKGSEARKG